MESAIKLKKIPIDRAEALQKCQRCPALRHQFSRLRRQYPDYWNLPVPGTGPEDAKLMILGLAPGLHGANRTGIPFVGDASGNLLHKTLAKLELTDAVRITNVLKCLPKQNKPSGAELGRCHRFLVPELEAFIDAGGQVIFALGRVAHDRVLKSMDVPLASRAFAHGAIHALPGGLFLVDSYHCSRYNTQTGRLTETMFLEALSAAARLAA